jgi:hypothetical protein
VSARQDRGIAVNAEGGCKVLEGWAELDIDAAAMMQHSKAVADPDRMSVIPPTGDNFAGLQKFISLRQDSKRLNPYSDVRYIF